MHNKVELTFGLGEDAPLIKMVIDLSTKRSKILYTYKDESLLHVILLPRERNYDGIESRFQFWFREPNTTLPEFIDRFKKTPFLYGGQINLTLDIRDLTDEEWQAIMEK
jgi:hypothetical protein